MARGQKRDPFAGWGEPTAEERNYLLGELEKDDAAVCAAAEHLAACEAKYAAALDRRNRIAGAIAILRGDAPA